MPVSKQALTRSAAAGRNRTARGIHKVRRRIGKVWSATKREWKPASGGHRTGIKKRLQPRLQTTRARKRSRKLPSKPAFHRTGTDLMKLAPGRTAGAIVTAMNEEETIGRVLEELNRLPLHEVIVVINGSTDATLQEAKRAIGENGLIVHYPEPLGYDVGRSVGVRAAQSDILLFLDGDFVVPAEKLVPFVSAIDAGADVALNNLQPFAGVFRKRDDVSILKEFLNRSVGRPDLSINSMTAVPHAISRNALTVIGASKLAVPPLAQAIALKKGLKFALAASVNVYGPNRIRTHNTGLRNPVARLIVGDHLEALKELMALQGHRLAFPDDARQRFRIREGTV